MQPGEFVDNITEHLMVRSRMTGSLVESTDVKSRDIDGQLYPPFYIRYMDFGICRVAGQGSWNQSLMDPKDDCIYIYILFYFNGITLQILMIFTQ